MRVPKPGEATVEDLLARGEEERLELIAGTLVEKAAPSWEHANAQGGVIGQLGRPFHRRPGGRFPGGWWILPELDVQLGPDVFRPDVSGFRRERVPELPRRTRPIQLRPDWICEVLSQSNEGRDRVEKLRAYFVAGVPHYWILNPVEGTLEVYRRTELAYALVLSAHRGERVRAEPFDAIEVSVDELLGADPEDES